MHHWGALEKLPEWIYITAWYTMHEKGRKKCIQKKCFSSVVKASHISDGIKRKFGNCGKVSGCHESAIWGNVFSMFSHVYVCIMFSTTSFPTVSTDLYNLVINNHFSTSCLFSSFLLLSLCLEEVMRGLNYLHFLDILLTPFYTLVYFLVQVMGTTRGSALVEGILHIRTWGRGSSSFCLEQSTSRS